ncbi:tyrosine-type recombinase/integrase [Amycolatopsis sp. NPDC005961]|uniref:tyrosine-type recombinase/integrase n=1 Tax=Amycolatopsis sp. NPDC005961 TaxID=3156720 RepID=UPI0033FEE8D7
MPSTEKLPSGRYRGLFVDADGKKQRVPGTFPRKSDAKEAAVDAEAKAKRRAATSDGTLSAGTLFRDWWEQLREDRTFQSDTPEKEASLYRLYLEPKWGGQSLNGIKRLEVKQWVATDLKVRPGMGPAYVRKIFGLFRLIMNAAVDHEILDASPCVRIKLPEVPKRAKPFVTAAEVGEMRGKYSKRGSVYADMMTFGLEVGMRPGELAGLHVTRVDRKRRKIHVVDVYVERAKRIRPIPKDNEFRTVPMTDLACEIYDRRTADRDLKAGCGCEHYDGKSCSSVLLFVNIDGRPATQSGLRRHMQRAGAKVDIDVTGGYELRRGYATRAVEGGADVLLVQRKMGHADLEELAAYVQETEASDAQLLAALGEPRQLKAVGPRGTKRGTKSRNQALPKATGGDATKTS